MQANEKTMKLLSVRDYSAKLRLTVQSTGKLCFTEETARTLAVVEKMPVRFSLDEEADGGQLYMTIASEKDADAFLVRKSGKTLYLPTSGLLDGLGIDYKSNAVSFQLIRATELDEELKGTTYRMKKAVAQRKEVEKKEEE